MDYIKFCTLDETLKDPLEIQHPSCFYCNGFYGPCFGEPVCATCHDFMYAEDFEQFNAIAISSSGLYQPEKDDGDSGNDEPSEEAAPGSRGNSSRPERIPAVEMAVEEEEEDVVAVEPIMNPDEIEHAGGVGGGAVVVSRSPENDTENSIGDDEPMNVDGIGMCFPTMRDNRERFPGPGPSRWPLRPEERMENRLALLTTPRLHESASVPNKEDMSQKIPPEIWAAIFRKLDDVSLLMASKVNSKWKAIVLDQHANSKWEEFVKLRWPLFHPIYSVADWYTVYSDFIDSVPCKLCFINLLVDLPGEIWNGDPSGPGRCLRSVRLHKELKWLRMDHPDGIEAIPLDNLNYNWLARINGPPQSPYQGGVFYMNLKVPHDYPLKPPIVRFLTKLFHPNVSRHGDIGIDCIQHNWTLALTIPQILLSVQSLLTDPYLETNMEPSISELYKKDRPKFDKMAKVWTWKIWSYSVFALLDYVEYIADTITGDYELYRRTEYKPEEDSGRNGNGTVPHECISSGDLEPMTPGTLGKRTKRIKLVLDINVSPGGPRIVNVSANDVRTPDGSPSFPKRILIRLVRTFSGGVKIVKRILVIVHNIFVPHAKINTAGPPRENRIYKSPTRRLPGYRRILAEFPFGLFGLQLTSRKCIISVDPLDGENDANDKSEVLETSVVINTPRKQPKRKLSDSDSEVLTSPFSGLSSEGSSQKNGVSIRSINTSDSEDDELGESIHSSEDNQEQSPSSP